MGPFQLTLSTEPAKPRVGRVKFFVTVTRGGQPVTDATVTVGLSMPLMKMGGPDVTLKAAGDRYEGTADLAMGGENEAKATVARGADYGTVVYRFSASQ